MPIPHAYVVEYRVVDACYPPACVIGGTSLMGGRGTVSGAVVGALIMASLDNGMSLLNVENYTQYIVKGAVLVAAVGFDMLGRRKS